MKRSIFVIALLLVFVGSVFAQYNAPTNYNWTFAYNAGLNFTGGGAPATFSPAIFSNEACATVSNSSGNLLFYTDGDAVWDNTNTVMPSGSVLTPYICGSATQGAMIVPVLSNPNQYYIFSIEEMEDYIGGDPLAPRMFYSIIDMTLHGGLGDVVPGTAGTLLQTQVTEKQVAIPGNSCNMWLVTHSRDTGVFKVYEITAAGISTTPVVSAVGTFNGYFGYDIGVMKSSPDHHKLLLQCDHFVGYTTLGGTELYDFDPSTGIVSNCRVLDSIDNSSYGADFSPDNTKVYAHQVDATTGNGVISQYNITLPTAAAIRASRIDVANVPGGFETNMKLAPDGKIYVNGLAALGGSAMDCITNPNGSGAACNYVSNYITLTGSTFLGLPTVYEGLSTSDTTRTHTDTSVCIAPGGSVIITAPTTGSYLWYDGVTTATHTETAYGSYVVAISNGCGVNYDTIKLIAELPDTTYHTRDTSMCSLLSAMTLTGPPGYTTYVWNDASAAATLTVTSAGVYWVKASNTCGNMRVDTFHVTYISPDTTHISHDTVVCASLGSITLTALAGYSSYFWNTGISGASITTAAAGTYYVYCHTGCSTVVDTIHFYATVPGVTINVHDTSFCFPGNLVLYGTSGFSNYLWQDGSTGSLFTATGAGTYYVDASNSCTDIIDTFHVVASSVVFSLGNDTTICIDYKLVVPVQGPGVSYLWQNGSTDSFFYTYYSGLYYATVTNDGCSYTDSINVEYDHLQQNIHDTFLCKGTPFSINLVATVPQGGSVLWNNGSTNPELTVTDSGTYWVFVKKNECEILDTVHVVTGYCDCWLLMPDAFTPNDDGRNDVVKPTIQPGCTISGYQFSIYNRWGEMVFTTDRRDVAWDGKYKGVVQDIGTYMYTLTYYAGVYDKPVSKTGDITLLR